MIKILKSNIWPVAAMLYVYFLFAWKMGVKPPEPILLTLGWSIFMFLGAIAYAIAKEFMIASAFLSQALGLYAVALVSNTGSPLEIGAGITLGVLTQILIELGFMIRAAQGV